MKLAFYIGTHLKDGLPARLGAKITRLVQKGPYAKFTHVEAIHAEHSDGAVTIASSSLRDGGVRDLRTTLNPDFWRIVDVPCFEVERSLELLETTRGAKYDIYGAIATAFIGHQDEHLWFCNEWVGYPYLKAAGNIGPHQLGAIALSFGTEITESFFMERESLTAESDPWYKL